MPPESFKNAKNNPLYKESNELELDLSNNSTISLQKGQKLMRVFCSRVNQCLTKKPIVTKLKV